MIHFKQLTLKEDMHFYTMFFPFKTAWLSINEPLNLPETIKYNIFGHKLLSNKEKNPNT